MRRAEPTANVSYFSHFEEGQGGAAAVDGGDAAGGADETAGNTASSDRSPKRGVSLNMVLREILFFLALVLTTYDAFQNSPPKISRVPPAVPFFDKSSLVLDWYKGQLTGALLYISKFEVSLVMYYAPWDAESQHVRQEFDKVAQTMFKKVHFSAVNCWNPGGECRLYHNKISVWPIIMAYTSHSKSVMYTGPKDSASMIRFLGQVIAPLQRLNTVENVNKLLGSCDVVALGYTPMSDGPASYNAVYGSALKSLETDPFGDVCFGIVTSEHLAGEMGVEMVPTLRLMMWNETLEYPNDSSFVEEAMVSWIWGHVHRRASWITPPWQKSYSMQALFSQGPVLVLFTPRNLYLRQTPNYDLLRETALEFNNCDNPWVTKLFNLSKDHRKEYAESQHNLTLTCREDQLLSRAAHSFILKSISQHSLKKPPKNGWLNKTSCKNDAKGRSLQSLLLGERSHLSPGLGEEVGCCVRSAITEKSCQADEKFTEQDEELMSMLEKYSVVDIPKSTPTSMLDSSTDPRSPGNLQKRRLRESCALLHLSKTLRSAPPSAPVSDAEKAPSIEGLACKINRTLAFIAVDSVANHHFVESLGIDIANAKDNTAVVILDNEHETQYLLQDSLGEKSLRQFIYNFTKNKLPRNLRMVARSNSKYTHFYGSNRLQEHQMLVERDAEAGRGASSGNPWCQMDRSDGHAVCLTELNSVNFKDFIMQKNKSVLLVLCGGGSGGLLSMSLLTVARSLRGLGDMLQVARLDASRNDLPWQYTVAKYPTIVFFPAKLKDESRSYPENQAVTVEGLLAFVMSGLEPPVRLHAQILLCNQTQDLYGMRQCIMGVRKSTAGLIGDTLRRWRRAALASIKGLLLKRLYCLRSLAITLATLPTTKLPADHPNLKLLLDGLKKLTKVWDVKIVGRNVEIYDGGNYRYKQNSLYYRGNENINTIQGKLCQDHNEVVMGRKRESNSRDRYRPRQEVDEIKLDSDLKRQDGRVKKEGIESDSHKQKESNGHRQSKETDNESHRQRVGIDNVSHRLKDKVVRGDQPGEDDLQNEIDNQIESRVKKHGINEHRQAKEDEEGVL